MTACYQVSLYVRVTDEADLYDEAHARAQQDFNNDIEPEVLTEMIGTRDEPDVHGCLRMLLDPGTSPSGTEILDSSVE